MTTATLIATIQGNMQGKRRSSDTRMTHSRPSQSKKQRNTNQDDNNALTEFPASSGSTASSNSVGQSTTSHSSGIGNITPSGGLTSPDENTSLIQHVLHPIAIKFDEDMKALNEQVNTLMENERRRQQEDEKRLETLLLHLLMASLKSCVDTGKSTSSEFALILGRLSFVSSTSHLHRGRHLQLARNTFQINAWIQYHFTKVNFQSIKIDKFFVTDMLAPR